jgi:hypothetical protein
VDEPSINNKTVVANFFGGLKNYKHNKPLEDLVVLGMTVKEFSQHDNKDYMKFEYGKPLVPKHVHVKFLFMMKKFRKWYYCTCVSGLNFIEGKILGDIFNNSNFDLHVELAELHTIFSLKMLNNTMMTTWCCYKYFLISCVLNNIVRNLMTRCSCAV